MASLVPGFEYDIFISYRHNDNRSGWVTEFVHALQEELAATIKDPVSVYFDTNPHDGLLETHSVNKSLEGKLKCLIFIPVISQTYCDLKSFAWQHEFCVFNRMANEDPFGRDIRLHNGNVANRVLPVRIHDLDDDDRLSIETQLGGFLRSIDFIYKEAGVNRPLTRGDARTENLNKTEYKNQVNKLANTIKDILSSIRNPLKTVSPLAGPSIDKREVQKNSILVLPFVNMSNDPDQEYFSDGLTEEIISDLSGLQHLLVISRSSSMTFKGSKSKISDITREVNVRYALEGSVRKAGSSIRITVQLIDSANDAHIWAEKYNGTIDDIFSIQEKVSRSVVDALKMKLSHEEDLNIHRQTFNNVQAYEYYLRAKAEMLKWNPTSIQFALELLQKALSSEGPSPILHAAIAYAYWSFANLGIDAPANYTKAEVFVKKTFSTDPESPEGNLVEGLLNQTRYANQPAAIRSFKKVLKSRQNDTHALTWLSIGFVICGKFEASLAIAKRLMAVDPLNAISRGMPSVINFYSGQFENLGDRIFDLYLLEPENSFYKYFTAICYVFEGKTQEALEFIEDHVKSDGDAILQITIALKHALQYNTVLVLKILENPSVREVALIDCQYSQFLSSLCAMCGLHKEALYWLENAVRRGFSNYLFLRDFDPSYLSLRTNPDFQTIVLQAQRDWYKIEDE